jgi:hypothetical protein
LTIVFGSILGFVISGFASFSRSAVDEAVAVSTAVDATEHAEVESAGKTRKQNRKKVKAI